MKDPGIILNGLPMEFDVGPQFDKGRVIAPLRPLAEALGAEVDYDNKARKAIVRRGSTRIEVLAPAMNGKYSPVSSAQGMRITGKIINDRMLVPVSWLARHLADGWIWDAKTSNGFIRGGRAWSDEDFVAFARWGEILWMRATFTKNQTILKERGLGPPPVFRKESDLQSFLGAYWSQRAIRELWEEGNMGKAVDGNWGLHGDGAIDPMEARSWRVLMKSADEVRLEALLPRRGKVSLTGQKILYILRPDPLGAFKIQERIIGYSM